MAKPEYIEIELKDGKIYKIYTEKTRVDTKYFAEKLNEAVKNGDQLYKVNKDIYVRPTDVVRIEGKYHQTEIEPGLFIEDK